MSQLEAEQQQQTVSACPCCGSYPSTGLAAPASPLFAVCDVLVVKALEKAGHRIVRQGRNRHQQMNGRPYMMAHTLWRPTPEEVVKALKGAWDVVPVLLNAHGCCNITARQTQVMLDEYVTDLLITGTHHDSAELRYRFETRLGIRT